jgi:isoquinoline 1-oxidoreductase beta subunit
LQAVAASALPWSNGQIEGQITRLMWELIDSGHHPSGVGEPRSTVGAPAVANAIYNAVSVRVRHMPITADAVLAGLKKKA